jgi:hypothetical protein
MNLETDLLNSHFIASKVRQSADYAQNLYAALCNNTFTHTDLFEIISDNTWVCSWRHASAIVAKIKGTGDYLDWYCSGMSADDGSVTEGTITNEILLDIKSLNWLITK